MWSWFEGASPLGWIIIIAEIVAIVVMSSYLWREREGVKDMALRRGRFAKDQQNVYAANQTQGSDGGVCLYASAGGVDYELCGSDEFHAFEVGTVLDAVEGIARDTDISPGDVTLRFALDMTQAV